MIGAFIHFAVTVIYFRITKWFRETFIWFKYRHRFMLNFFQSMAQTWGIRKTRDYLVLQPTMNNRQYFFQYFPWSKKTFWWSEEKWFVGGTKKGHLALSEMIAPSNQKIAAPLRDKNIDTMLQCVTYQWLRLQLLKIKKIRKYFSRLLSMLLLLLL